MALGTESNPTGKANDFEASWKRIDQNRRQVERNRALRDGLDSYLVRRAIWKETRSAHWQFYCPLCKVSRNVRGSPTPYTTTHFSQVAAATAFAMLCTWNAWGIKGMVWAFPLWIGFETLYRFWLRAQLECQQCGFDPVLFLADSERARAKVEAFWATKNTPPV